MKNRLKGLFCIFLSLSIIISNNLIIYAEDLGEPSKEYDLTLYCDSLYNSDGSDEGKSTLVTKGTRIQGDTMSGGVFKVYINGKEVSEYPENTLYGSDGMTYAEGYSNWYTLSDPPSGYSDPAKLNIVPNPEIIENDWGSSIEYMYYFMFINYNLDSYDLLYSPGFGNGNLKWEKGIKQNQAITLDDGSSYSRGGYKLVGWSNDKDNEYNDPDYELSQPDITNLAEDGVTAVLYANWKRYTVEYNPGDGLELERVLDTEMDDNNKLKLEDATDKFIHTQPEYKFVGWKKDINSDKVDFQPSEIIDPSDFSNNQYRMTLYAHYEKNIDEYNIQYDPNDGSSNIYTQKSEVGKEVKLSDGSSLSKVGYTFVGWSKSKDGSKEIYKPSEVIPSLSNVKDDTVTLYAQWTKDTYTIKYDTNDGSGTTYTQKAEVIEKVQLDSGSNLVRDKYKFIGWSTSKDGSTGVYQPSEIVSSLTSVKDSNVILYAQWKNKTYTINYNSNIGGTSDTISKVVNLDEDIHLLGEDTFKNEGYVLKEWNTSPDGRGTSYPLGGVVRDLAKSGGTIDLYAQWEGIVQVPPSVDNGTQTPPSNDNGTQTPPSVDNGTQTPPSNDNGTQTPPSVDNGTQTPPSVDNGNQTPPSNGSGSNTGSGGDANSGVSDDNNGSSVGNNGSNNNGSSSESNQTPPSSGGNNQTVPDNDVEDDESDSNIFEINLEFTGSDITLEEVGTDKDYTVSLEGTEIIGGTDYKEENGKIVLDKTLFIGKDTGSYIVEVVQGSDKYIYRVRVNVPSLKIRKLMGRNDFFKLKTLNTTDVKSISWKSNNTSLCTVDENGWVKTKNKTGITSVECDIITRTGYRYKFICKIDIRPRIKVTHNYSSARIKDKSNVNVMLDKELHMGVPVNIIYNNLSKDAQIKYYTSDSSIARVTKDGKLEGLKKGKCNVKVVITQNKFKYVYYFNAVVVK